MTFWDWANNHEVIAFVVALVFVISLHGSIRYLIYVVGFVRSARAGQGPPKPPGDEDT